MNFNFGHSVQYVNALEIWQAVVAEFTLSKSLPAVVW